MAPLFTMLKGLLPLEVSMEMPMAEPPLLIASRSPLFTTLTGLRPLFVIAVRAVALSAAVTDMSPLLTMLKGLKPLFVIPSRPTAVLSGTFCRNVCTVHDADRTRTVRRTYRNAVSITLSVNKDAASVGHANRAVSATRSGGKAVSVTSRVDIGQDAAV